MSDDLASRMKLYCGIVTEAGARLTTINKILEKKIQLPPRPAIEHCHLQLRLISELIAIGCLVTHGDIEATRTGRMRSAYSADWILNALEKLHAKFFPIPAKVRRKEGGRFSVRIVRPPNTITKDEVLKLYAECGKVLHRGSIKTFGLQSTSQSDFDNVRYWAVRLSTLFNQHIIRTSSGRLLLMEHDPVELTGHAYELRGVVLPN